MYIIAALVNFINIGLRVIQTKNIIGVYYKSAYVTSWLMSVVAVANIVIVTEDGYVMIIPIGLGGSLGCITSMYFHDKLMKRKNDMSTSKDTAKHITSLVHTATITTYSTEDTERKYPLATKTSTVIGESATSISNLSISCALTIGRNAKEAREKLADREAKYQELINE